MDQLHLTRDLRVADRRDEQLDRMSRSRTELVNTTAAQDPCTRRWAAELAYLIGARAE